MATDYDGLRECIIGGSFFRGSSVAIHAAGPSFLLSYILVGGLVYLILYALSEMTVANPTVAVSVIVGIYALIYYLMRLYKRSSGKIHRKKGFRF